MSENSGLLLNAFKPSSKLSSKLLKNSKASCCSRKFTGSPQSLSKGKNKSWLATHSVLNTSSSKTRTDRKESLQALFQIVPTKNYRVLLSSCTVYCAVQGNATCESVDEILKCDHSNEYY